MAKSNDLLVPQGRGTSDDGVSDILGANCARAVTIWRRRRHISRGAVLAIRPNGGPGGGAGLGQRAPPSGIAVLLPCRERAFCGEAFESRGKIVCHHV